MVRVVRRRGLVGGRVGWMIFSCTNTSFFSLLVLAIVSAGVGCSCIMIRYHHIHCSGLSSLIIVECTLDHDASSLHSFKNLQMQSIDSCSSIQGGAVHVHANDLLSSHSQTPTTTMSCDAQIR